MKRAGAASLVTMRHSVALLLAAILFAPALWPQSHDDFLRLLVAAAVDRANHKVRYNAAYVAIPYPSGDVPAEQGVCTDEIIRSYRAVGIDLQKEVHEDIVRDPAAYGKKSAKRADANIDHRRVENLIAFFQRHAEKLPLSYAAQDYAPGDIVTWNLGNGHGHIGLVVDRQPLLFSRYKVLHNIGAGPQIEDVLFDWKITGHFRYYGPPPKSAK